jgi:hypothetical protein
MSAMVDIDLLADYIGGALDGTPQEQQVRELISTDPAWRRAAAELSLALDAVATDLAVTALAPEPMPADLIARFDELLAGPEFTVTAVPAARAGTGERVVPRAKARRRRLARWSGPIAIAAGIVAVVGGVVGGVVLTGRSNESEQTSSAPASAELRDAASAPPTVASGGNFTREQISNMPASRTLQSTPQTGAEPGVQVDSTIPAELTSVSAGDRLARCLELVTAQLPGAVQLVDFARFENQPALIITIKAADGTWAFVAGADCGAPQTDELYRVRMP